MDENLFYKAVDKTKVHSARLHQHHTNTDRPRDYALPDDCKKYGDSIVPPYPFDTGNTLLALTKKHNVSYLRALILVF